MEFNIKPLSPSERKTSSGLVLGKTVCPACKQDDIKVVNDHGEEGNPSSTYLENHYLKSEHVLCMGSEKSLSDF